MSALEELRESVANRELVASKSWLDRFHAMTESDTVWKVGGAYVLEERRYLYCEGRWASRSRSITPLEALEFAGN